VALEQQLEFPELGEVDRKADWPESRTDIFDRALPASSWLMGLILTR
jgi:hypothetical protein